MAKNQITISIDSKGHISMTSVRAVNYQDLLTIFCSVMLNVMRDMARKAPKEKAVECKGWIYDAFNVAVSKVLSNFAPEFELRPGLTAAAIKECEDRIIMEGRMDGIEPGT